jgi:hypothetical protein
MTQIEAARKILAQGNCDNINCSECSMRISDGFHNRCILASERNKSCRCFGPASSAGDLAPDKRPILEKWLAEHDTDGKPITAFEVGKWYKWVGPKKMPSCWVQPMANMLNGEPHKCISAYQNNHASFVGTSGIWNWSDGFEHFREVPEPYATTKSSRSQAIALHISTDSAAILKTFFNPTYPKTQERRDLRARLLDRL